MRLLRLPFFVLLLAGLATAPASAKVKVVTTLQDFASIADSVGGDRIETFAMVKGYQDPHFVDPKPSLVLKLSKADLLIAAGLELEIGYLPPLIDQSRNEKIRPGSAAYLDVSNGCEILGRPAGQITRAMGDVHPYGNPHYWTDPNNGVIIARAIAAKLTELDPAGAATYKDRLAAFETKLREKDKEWLAKMAPYAGAPIITFHDSWPNFAKHFKLDVAGHVEPKPGIPPSPSHTLEIVNLIISRKIKIILVEPYFDMKTPKYIGAKTGAAVVVAYPSVGGVPEITDYFSLFDANVRAIVAAMEGKK
jgi:zinc/manganese transport system substrate-binding protein